MDRWFLVEVCGVNTQKKLTLHFFVGALSPEILLLAKVSVMASNE